MKLPRKHNYSAQKKTPTFMPDLFYSGLDFRIISDLLAFLGLYPEFGSQSDVKFVFKDPGPPSKLG
jgi:hypothetical protein